MKPDQAISKVAHEAVSLLERYQAKGGDGAPIEMIRTLAAVGEALQMVSDTLVAGMSDPGVLSPIEQAHVVDEAHAAAAGVLLVCSFLPGVDSLVAPMAH